MDVGDPSNFVRIRELFGQSASELEKVLSAYAFDDESTRQTIAEVFAETAYVLDPHGAVAYMGLNQYLANLLAIAAVTFWNFWFNLKLSWRVTDTKD